MTLDIQGNLGALIRDVQRWRPDTLTAQVNRAWADEASERLRGYVGGGPMSTYLTARSGDARKAVRATVTARGAVLSATGPGMTFLEDGGTILPRRGKYLTFRLHQPGDGRVATGQWIRTRKVVIPARHMVRDAGDQASDLLPTYLARLLEA